MSCFTYRLTVCNFNSIKLKFQFNGFCICSFYQIFFILLEIGTTVETGYKNILAGNLSIRPSINFTIYKNIPVIRTLYSTPDDVLITGFHCNCFILSKCFCI